VLTACNVISLTGSALSLVALPFAVLAAGGSAADLGYVAAAQLIPLSVVLFALAAPLPLGVVLAASATAGACLELTEVCWGATLAQQIPPDRLSRIASYDQFGGLALTPLGAAVAGPLAAAFGTAAVLTAGGALIVVLPLLLLATVPEIRRLRAPLMAPASNKRDEGSTSKQPGASG
jgi:hypothetical protein